MPKQRPNTKLKKRREPLEKQMARAEDRGYLKPMKSKSTDHDDNASDDELVEDFLPEKLSSRILQKVVEQQEEIAAENADLTETKSMDVAATGPVPANRNKKAAMGKNTDRIIKLRDEEADVLSDDEALFEAEAEGDTLDEIEVSPEDEAALAMFMPSSAPIRRTLADIIMEKIKEKGDNIGSMPTSEEFGNTEQKLRARLDPKVVEVYVQVGKYLSQYKSGKVPKAFKIIPSLKNWEEILFLTNPEGWTAQATFAATRLFASNLNNKMAQRFYNFVLLPRIQQDITEHKKLNFHLYQAVKKAIYKPAAFFKGLLLPLAESDCTVREAIIMASVLAKVSIPMLHSSVALLKLAEMEFQGTTCLFMKTLLDKKYSLPFKVLDALVRHFVQFSEMEMKLPVIWHQNLLTFVQRYKNELTTDQKNLLKQLIRVQTHHLLTAEIKRELTAAPVLDPLQAFKAAQKAAGSSMME